MGQGQECEQNNFPRVESALTDSTLGIKFYVPVSYYTDHFSTVNSQRLLLNRYSVHYLYFLYNCASMWIRPVSQNPHLAEESLPTERFIKIEQQFSLDTHTHTHSNYTFLFKAHILQQSDQNLATHNSDNNFQQNLTFGFRGTAQTCSAIELISRPSRV